MPQHPRLVSLFVNTAWNLLGPALLSVLSFILLPVMLRGLGLEGYALYTLMGMFSGYLALLTFGSGTAVIKFVSERHGKGDAVGVRAAVRTGLALHTLPVLVGAAALFAARGWVADSVLEATPAARGDAAFVVGAAAVAAVAASLLQLAVCLNQGLQRFALANGILVAQSAAVLGGSALMAWLGLGLRPIGVYFIAAQAVLCAVLLGRAWASLPPLPAGEREGAPETSRAFASFALHAFLAQLAWSATFQWDRLVLGAQLPLADLAYYSVPAMMMQKLYVAPASVMATLFPVVSEMEGRGESDAIGRVYRRGGQFVLWLIMPGFVLVALFAPQFLSLWLGGDFSERGVWPLRFIAAGYFFHTLGAMPMMTASGSGRPAMSSAYLTAQAALCLVGWVFLIPRWGIAGAAASFGLAQALSSLPFVWTVSRRLFGMSAGEYVAEVLARPLAAGGALWAALWPLRESATGWGSLVLLCGLGSAAYYAAGAFLAPAPERDLVRRLFAGLKARAAGGPS